MKAVGLVRLGEVVVRFNPLQLEGHAELLDVRMMALVTTRPHWHVLAVLRGEGAGGGGHRFRLYDNDGRERRDGKGRLASTDELADTANCTMYAVVDWDSELRIRASMALACMAWAQPRAGEAGESAEMCVNTTMM